MEFAPPQPERSAIGPAASSAIKPRRVIMLRSLYPQRRANRSRAPAARGERPVTSGGRTLLAPVSEETIVRNLVPERQVFFVPQLSGRIPVETRKPIVSVQPRQPLLQHLGDRRVGDLDVEADEA